MTVTLLERHGFSFQLASTEQDQAVANLLNDNAIPGWISLSYRTQPGLHRPMRRDAYSHTVIGLRLSDGLAGGVASRSYYPCFLAGRPASIGWLNQLRIAPRFRNRPHLLRSGFDAIDALPACPRLTPPAAPWSLASVIADNRTARRILEANIEGFPRFDPLFDYRVFAIAARKAHLPPFVRRAAIEDQAAIMGFLNTQNRDRDLAPRLTSVDELFHGWAGLSIHDFLIYERAGEICGVIAVWDQLPFRSMHVVGYQQPLARLRPLVNLVARPTGLPRLPPPGQDLRQVYLTLLTTAKDDAEVMQALVLAALSLAKQKGAELAVIGLAESDPLAPLLQRNFRHRSYDSTIYRICRQDKLNPAFMSSFHRPKVEIGLL